MLNQNTCYLKKCDGDDIIDANVMPLKILDMYDRANLFYPLYIYYMEIIAWLVISLTLRIGYRPVIVFDNFDKYHILLWNSINMEIRNVNPNGHLLKEKHSVSDICIYRTYIHLEFFGFFIPCLLQNFLVELIWI